MPRTKTALISSSSLDKKVAGEMATVEGVERRKVSLLPSIAINSFVNKTFLLAALLLASSIFVRLYCLDKQDLECDEMYTICAANGQHYIYFNSQSEFKSAHFPTTIEGFNRLLIPQLHSGMRDVTDVLRQNVQMPLYFYLMHYWLKLAGTSEWSVRFPSVVFSMLAVLIMFFLGKELVNTFVGFTSALLMSLMPEQIYFSQQARMYPLLILLMVVATYSLALAQKYPNSMKPRLLFLVASACGFHTHYVYLFCITAHALYIWIISPLGKHYRRAWFFNFIGIAATFIPWGLLASLDQQKTSSDIIAWAQDDLIFDSLRQQVFSIILRLVSIPEAPFGWLTVVAAAGFILLGVISLRSNRLTLWLLFLLVALPVVGILAMDFLLHTNAIGMIRYWLIITPAIYLLMACGINWITKRRAPLIWQVTAAVTLIVFVGWTGINTARGELRPKPDHHRDLAQFLQERIKGPNNEFIMTEGLNAIPLVIAYYNRSMPQRQINMLSLNWAVDPANKQQLRAVMLPRKDAWLVTSGHSKGGNMLKKTGYLLYGEPKRFGHIMVFHYQRSDSSQLPAEAK